MQRKKVVLLGSFGVGKTSLVRRFVEDRFEDEYLSTVGVKVSRRQCAEPAVTLLVWDISGREEFERMRPSYLRGASAALLVCDVTRPETFGTLLDEREALERARPGAGVVVAANKVDLLPEGAIPEALQDQVGTLGASLHRTSALDGRGVGEAFRELATLALG